MRTRAKPVLIAHRAASAYLPEHSLIAVAMAHAFGADYIEQDVILTKDGVPIVVHDIHLDSTTDVAARFPDRAHADGHVYGFDFTLEEIRTLSLHERTAPSGERVYPQRFPLMTLPLGIPTLEEEVRLISGLNASRGTRTGLYIELKAPRRHAALGLDPINAVMAVLAQHGLDHAGANVFLQCFDDVTLKSMHRAGVKLPRIQLIADNSWGEDSEVDYDWLRTNSGLDAVVEYAQGIGPWLPHLFEGSGRDYSPLVRAAHERGLLVHPYTLRKDDLSIGASSFDELQKWVFEVAEVDGAFSDFSDLTRQYIDSFWPGDAKP